MKRSIFFANSRLLLPFLFLITVSFQNLFANYSSVGRYSIHRNSTLNSTSMLNITAFQEIECLIKCLDIPICVSLDVVKERMENYGKMTCHLFNVTHNLLSLDLDSNDSIDHYKTELFDDCFGAKRARSSSGVHKLQRKGGLTFEAFCDMETDSGGWTVIQKRFNGTVDFAKPWVDYKKGFGDVNGEFWLGLDAMHELTKGGNSTLRVDMWDNGDYGYAVYSNVKVSDESQGYRLDYGELINGTAMSSDSMKKAKGMMFSTYDQDNDAKDEDNCSQKKGKAGWWFRGCAQANPNGAYIPGPTSNRDGLYWGSFCGFNYSVQRIEIKIRRQ